MQTVIPESKKNLVEIELNWLRFLTADFKTRLGFELESPYYMGKEDFKDLVGELRKSAQKMEDVARSIYGDDFDAQGTDGDK